MVKRKIEIQHNAKHQLWEVYKYIRKDSLQNAEKVRKPRVQRIR